MGNVVLNGATSGQITLQPTAVAGTNTLTLPAATDTLVGKATTDTLTNKTIGSAGLQIAGSSSGTTTLVAAATASGTVTIAAQTGTLNAAGPACHATAGGAQTVTNGVNTKATLVEDFDTNSNFASSTFTPTVAGYYQVNGVVGSNAATSLSYVGALIFKNGALYTLCYCPGYSGTAGLVQISDIVYCNGSTDYLELYVRVSGTGTLTINNNTLLSACLVRGA
jgi:hypothetical protein